jgi:hypothetical protein
MPAGTQHLESDARFGHLADGARHGFPSFFLEQLPPLSSLSEAEQRTIKRALIEIHVPVLARGVVDNLMIVRTQPHQQPAIAEPFQVFLGQIDLAGTHELIAGVPNLLDADRAWGHVAQMIELFPDFLSLVRQGVEAGNPLEPSPFGVVLAEHFVDKPFARSMPHLAGVDTHLLAAAQQLDAPLGVSREIVAHLLTQRRALMRHPLYRVVPHQQAGDLMVPPTNRR